MKLDHGGARRPLCGFQGFPGGRVVKSRPVSAEDSGDAGLIPGSGRSPGEGHGNPPQYFCLENPTDRGAWRATVREVAELDMTEQLSLSHTHTHTHTHKHI